MTRRVPFLLLVLFTTLGLAFARSADAAPQAHILRIDPRAGISNGKPTLTTVIEVVQFKPLSEVLSTCAGVTGAATLSCWSAALEKPGRSLESLPLPRGERAPAREGRAGEDTLTKFVDKTTWGKAQGQPDVGTAWLIVGRRVERDGRALRRRARHRARVHRGHGPERL